MPLQLWLRFALRKEIMFSSRYLSVFQTFPGLKSNSVLNSTRYRCHSKLLRDGVRPAVIFIYYLPAASAAGHDVGKHSTESAGFHFRDKCCSHNRRPSQNDVRLRLFEQTGTHINGETDFSCNTCLLHDSLKTNGIGCIQYVGLKNKTPKPTSL